jgi:prephenate dehydrogenase
MWRDILLENKIPVLAAIDHYLREIKTLRAFIARGDGPSLLRFLTKSQKKRLVLP